MIGYQDRPLALYDEILGLGVQVLKKGRARLDLAATESQGQSVPQDLVQDLWPSVVRLALSCSHAPVDHLPQVLNPVS